MKCSPCVVSCAALAFASGASAQLDGRPLTADWLYPAFGSSIETHDLVVGPGIDLDPVDIVNDDSFSIDIADDTVTFIFHEDSKWSEIDFNGWHFADTQGAIQDIASYTVDSIGGGVKNADQIVTGNTADAFWADFGGVVVTQGDFITLKVTFVPAPGAALPLGLAALALGRRRR